jgi:predicted phage terminase large subunit-like protein
MDNLNNDLGKVRRELAAKSIKVFAEIYFPHYLEQSICSFHDDTYKTLYETSEVRDKRVAIAAPRNSAKTLIASTIYPVWSLCYMREKFIILLSDTKDKAVELLSHIKTEFEKNDKLISDFPEVCGDGTGSKPRRWKNDEIVTADGARIIALGSGQKIRGRRNVQARPSLIILDDSENEANTHTAEMREKLYNWLTKTVIKSGAIGTNVIVVGTILHFDSLLARLTDRNKMPGWEKRIYKSVISWATHQDYWQKWSAIFNYREAHMDKKGKEAAFIFFRDNERHMLEGTEVLWPQRESYYDLMVMREQEGESAFDSEKQNSPVDLKDCPFNPEEFYYWDDQFKSEPELIKSLDTVLDIFGGCDPATGKEGVKSDYSALVTIGRDRKTGIMYVLDADVAKRSPDAYMETILTYAQLRRYRRMAIESNNFQELIKREIERRAALKRIYLHLEGINNTSDKHTRIMSLQPLVKSGYLRFSRKHTILLEQLRYFPKGSHDDAPDSLELACRIARAPGKVTCVIV